MRNGKEAFDLQPVQGWTLAVSCAQYRAFCQQMCADVTQHEFVIHVLGTRPGYQSDCQASQAIYYDLCGESFLFCLPIHVSYSSLKTGSDGVQLLSC